MQIYIVAFLIFVNILLWLVMLLRFKNLFSTENILQKFRDEMESLIKDAQRNTALSINLIDEKIKELKAVSAEAERRFHVLRHELDSENGGAALERAIEEKSSFGRGSQGRAQRTKKSAPQEKEVRTPAVKNTAARAASRYKKAALPAEDEAVALTGLFAENAQKSLFDAEPQEIVVTRSGDSYGKVPVLKTDVIVSDKPLVPKKTFSRIVRELSDLGRSVDEIAAATNHSTTEVQLVLDMN